MRSAPLTIGFHCGAPTKSGDPCGRRVEYEGHRCPQHPPRTAADKAEFAARRKAVFAKREAKDDLVCAQKTFVRVALEHGLDHDVTRKAFAALRQLTKAQP